MKQLSEMNLIELKSLAYEKEYIAHIKPIL